MTGPTRRSRSRSSVLTLLTIRMMLPTADTRLTARAAAIGSNGHAVLKAVKTTELS